MNDNEVNKIIAEFMGNYYFTFEHPDGEAIEVHSMNPLHSGTMPTSYNWYTKSLDALVPVWENLGITSHRCENRPQNHFQEKRVRFTLYKKEMKLARELGVGINKSAAHATAKAILELRK